MSFVEYKNPVSVYNNQQKREYEKRNYLLYVIILFLSGFHQ